MVRWMWDTFELDQPYKQTESKMQVQQQGGFQGITLTSNPV